jgi:hypothetical protein
MINLLIQNNNGFFNVEFIKNKIVNNYIKIVFDQEIY